MKKSVISPRLIIIGTVILLMIPVVAFPDRYVGSVFDGMKLYVTSVLPAMLPFFFYSKILEELNFGYDVGALISKPLKKLFKAPAVSGYILVMSMLCGYPIGAKLVSDFAEKGILSKDEAKTTIAFCSTSGPLFVVGTVGMGMLGNKFFGFVILISHYLSALINGLIFGRKRKGGDAFLTPPDVSYDNILSDSMISTVVSVALVGGYVAIFNMATDLLFDINLIPLLAKGLTFFGLDSRLGEGALAGVVEVTKGCLILSKSGFPIKKIAPLCAFSITFGGMSVTLQSLTFLGKCKISPLYYLLTKTVQATTAFIICFLLCLIF